MAYRLDEIDKRILYRLVDDARNTSAPMIADEVNVSAGTIRNRIQQMEEEGIVVGYHANIDYERGDGRLMNLYMCNTTGADRERVAKQVLGISGVVNVRELMTGRGNLQIKAVGTDTQDLARIGRELSDLGIEIEDEGLIQREQFRPYQPFGPDDGHERQSITDFMSLTGGAEVVELTVTANAPMAHRTLKEAANSSILDGDVLVVAIEREETIITPKGDSEIRPDDLVTLFSRTEISNEVMEAFTGTPAKAQEE